MCLFTLEFVNWSSVQFSSCCVNIFSRIHVRFFSPSMSAAQSTTVHDRLLHPHLRHCSLAASAVHRLPSAVHTATPAFSVQSSGLFCGWPGGLELVTRLPARPVLTVFRQDLKTFFSRTQHIRGFAIMCYIIYC